MAPQLRGIVHRKMMGDIAQAIGIALAAGLAWRFSYAEPKKKKYENYYKNLDAEKEAKLMEAEQMASQ